MSIRSISILFPAVLLSSAVFSTLTLPFFLPATAPQVSTVEAITGIDMPVIVQRQNRNVAIRYIGGSLVLSVGAGFATVEVLRRWQQARSQAAASRLATRPSLPKSPPFPEGPQDDQLEVVPDYSLLDWSVEPPEALIQDWLQVGSDLHSVHPELESPAALSRAWEAAIATQANTVQELSGHYPTCRVSVPHLSRRLFAIQVADRYYCFFRIPETREEALEIAARLSRQGHDVVITPAEQGYAVWAWQPEASPEVNPDAVGSKPPQSVSQSLA